MRWILATGLAVAIATIAYAWLRGGDEHVTGEPLVLGDRRHHVLPARRERAPLLVLLHQRGGTPREIAWPELLEALEAADPRRPAVLLVDGGDHSYYHDREDFPWGTHVLDEAIPAARERLRTDAAREAIGGFSMGGFGALHLATRRRFCAVGAHSPALWLDGGETPEGAFDDAEDFEQHDLIEAAQKNPRLFRGARLWLDAGEEDPFRPALMTFSAALDLRPKIFRGDHSTGYWREHVDEYLRFYVAALARC